MDQIQSRKVVIVGAGAVGATYGYALAQSGLADEIVLLDQNDNLARGQVLDLAHGQPFFPPVTFRVGDSGDYADAQLVVITAGAAQKPGETRLQLLQKNATIMRSIMADINAQHCNAVIVIVSNPVDVMTHVALQCAGDGAGQIIGSGTVLDSARLRHFLSAFCQVDTRNVHAHVLGEHGDSEFVAWSMANIGGTAIEEFLAGRDLLHEWSSKREQIERQVRDSAYHIIDYKGATSFAVGLALVRITGAILRGESSVLTVSTRLEGSYGINDVCLSLPCIVSDRGVEGVITSDLSASEMKALHASADVLKQAISELESAGSA